MKSHWSWVTLVVIAVLLALCAFSIDSFHAKRCDERGGEWRGVNGHTECVMPK